MAIKVIMPKQGLQMTEGRITRWLVREGERVEADAPLFEMETDKLNIEIMSPGTGTLLKIVREEGETVPITEIIAVIGEAGEDISLLLETGNTDDGKADDGDKYYEKDLTADKKEKGEDSSALMKREPGERVFITPRAKAAAGEKGIDYLGVPGTGPDGLVIERDIINFKPLLQPVSRVTPLAAKIARQNDIKPDGIDGTGARGKVTRADVEAALAARNAPLGEAGAGKAAAAGKSRLVPFTGMRKVIADRMMQSLHGMAQANHRMKVDMSEAVRFREKLREAGVKVSFTDIFLKVVSRALLDFPMLNSSLTEEGIIVRDYVNLGMAVAVENGLIVPVIRNAERMTLKEISTASAGLADKAKKGGLMPDEYTGGTFTVTNLGMFDIDEFTAVINPPESGILAIGKIDRIPVAEGDAVVIRPILVLSLTYDHRIVDGAPAAQFLQRVKQLLQNPYLLI